MLARSETAAISDDLDDDSTSLDEKGKPWLDIVEAADVILSKIPHLQTISGLGTVKPQTIQRACKRTKTL
jgi:hypothetical protein